MPVTSSKKGTIVSLPDSHKPLDASLGLIRRSLWNLSVGSSERYSIVIKSNKFIDRDESEIIEYSRSISDIFYKRPAIQIYNIPTSPQKLRNIY
jgi:hypothetical protein